MNFTVQQNNKLHKLIKTSVKKMFINNRSSYKHLLKINTNVPLSKIYILNKKNAI